MRKHLSLLASLAALSFAVPALAHDDRGSFSARSSHDHKQLHDLVNGKVKVARFHGFDSVKGTANDAVRITHFAEDGTSYACGFDEDRDFNLTGYFYGDDHKWSTEPHRKRLSRLRFLGPGDDPTSNRKTTAQIYEPETGRISNRIYGNGRYYIGTDGHMQASIPAVVYDLCPDFPSPEALGLPLNAAQTSAKYSKLLAQDPSAPIKNFFTAPPAAPSVGNDQTSSLDASPAKAGDALVTLAEPAKTFAAQNNGQFITDAAGRFYTFSPLTNQILEIEGEDTVVRFATVSYLEGSPQTYRVQWSDGKTDLWPANEPLPFKATGLESRIGAFYAWLHRRSLKVNIDGFLNDSIHFLEANVLLVQSNGPAQHFASGDSITIVLRDGVTRSFHWTELAAASGWKG